MSRTQIGEIVLIFLSFHNQLKIYHWQTTSYARHQASGELVEKITTHIDKFIETIQGSRGKRLKILPNDSTIRFENLGDDDILKTLNLFKGWLLSDLSSILEPSDKDLMNIRDEILSDVNKTIYLFSLN